MVLSSARPMEAAPFAVTWTSCAAIPGWLIIKFAFAINESVRRGGNSERAQA
jgi:hypothetical protein